MEMRFHGVPWGRANLLPKHFVVLRHCGKQKSAGDAQFWIFFAYCWDLMFLLSPLPCQNNKSFAFITSWE